MNMNMNITIDLAPQPLAYENISKDQTTAPPNNRLHTRQNNTFHPFDTVALYSMTFQNGARMQQKKTKQKPKNIPITEIMEDNTSCETIVCHLSQHQRSEQ